MADTSWRGLLAAPLLLLAATGLLGACGDDSDSGVPGHQTIQTDIPGTGGAALSEALAVCSDTTPASDSVDVMGASGALLARRGSSTNDRCVPNERYTVSGGG